MLQRQKAPFYSVLALHARPDMRAAPVGVQRPGGQPGRIAESLPIRLRPARSGDGWPGSGPW